jgi:ribA/ribD-fused uncharacterized protein
MLGFILLLFEIYKLMSTTYIYFYGHCPIRHGVYSCLSNWYTTRFICDETGKTFDNVEQYMMWRKAILFNDIKTANEIMKTDLPAMSKLLGRSVSNFNQNIWDKNCVDIVMRGCFLKFSQNEYIKDILLNTNDAILAEASPYDTIWGIGLTIKTANACKNESEWRGQNLLGKCLMNVREKLKN